MNSFEATALALSRTLSHVASFTGTSDENKNKHQSSEESIT